MRLTFGRHLARLSPHHFAVREGLLPTGVWDSIGHAGENAFGDCTRHVMGNIEGKDQRWRGRDQDGLGRNKQRKTEE